MSDSKREVVAEAKAHGNIEVPQVQSVLEEKEQTSECGIGVEAGVPAVISFCFLDEI